MKKKKKFVQKKRLVYLDEFNLWILAHEHLWCGYFQCRRLNQMLSNLVPAKSSFPLIVQDASTQATVP